MLLDQTPTCLACELALGFTPLPTASTRIDVLIPVSNGAATLASAIDSIRAQTFGNFRMVVVDDGSSDETPRILARMAASDPRIVIVTRPHGGIVDALNAGLEHCTAELIARHDADDIAYPQRFAEQLAYLDAHPDCIAVSSFARMVDKDGRPTGGLSTSSVDGSDPTWVPCREPYLLHPFLMLRRSALLTVGGYRYVHHAEDADLYWRLQEIGRMHVIPKVLGDYRIHAQSVSGRSALDGRVSAINSQLAAISALRRRNNASDLQFTRSAIEGMFAARTPAGILAIGKRDLSAAESAYLQAAFAAKYLLLATHRPFAIELDDCRFIRAVLLPAELQLPAGNRRSLRKSRATLSARLLLKGRLRAALMLLSLDTLMQTGLQFGAHAIARCLPPGVRATIRRRQARTWLSRLP
jgi:glycosyltransferase involved in cell wall biosynthesis